MTREEREHILILFKQYSVHSINLSGGEKQMIERKQAFASQLTFDDVQLLGRAADAGMPEAICLLGACYIEGWEVSVDKRRGGALFLRAAELGNPYAQHTIAGWYMHGTGQYVLEELQGVPSPKNEVSDAMSYALGGEVCSKSRNLAIAWYKKACSQDFGPSLSALGKLMFIESNYYPERKNGFQMLEKAAAQGVWSAMYQVARVYELGDSDTHIARDRDEALKVYRELVRLGSPQAKSKVRELGGSWWRQKFNSKALPD